MSRLEGGPRPARLSATLAGLCGIAAGCAGRPLPAAAGGDAAVPPGDAASDGAPAACTPTNLPGGVSLCGTVGGKAVQYAPPNADAVARGLSEVDFEFLGPDGVWLEVWGLGAWRDNDPHQVSGWLLRPPPDWAGSRAWICGLAGTITHRADQSTDANLGQLAVLPACDLAGGPVSLHADVTAGVLSLPSGGGCAIGFAINGVRLEILAPTCPHAGVPLPLDGLRIVDRGARGTTSDVTACIGTGATLTALPDIDASSADQLVVDIPSMSEAEPCAPPVSGDLFMHVTLPPNPADAGPG